MSAVPPKLVPVKVADLRLDATYVAPSGRMCRLAPPPKKGEGWASGTSYLFDYVTGPGRGLLDADGFRLTRENIGLLREVRR